MPRFAKRDRETINARQVVEPILVLTRDGEVLANAGDWIIDSGGKHFEVCKPEVFAAAYEAIDVPNPRAEIS